MSMISVHGDSLSQNSVEYEPRQKDAVKFMGLPPSDWLILLLLTAIAVFCVAFMGEAFANSTLPGADASDKLEAAGTLLRMLDTALFKWGARIFAGLCIMSSAWSLKEQRFGIAIICIVGALIFGTAPQWVKNIFAISTGDSIFGN